MSQRKIIFLIIAAIAFLALAFWLYRLSQKSTQKTDVPASITIWINDGTSDAYAKLIEGFKKYAPEYKKMDITVEKQSSDSDRYRTLLLSSIGMESGGPDIFMLHSGEDAILESKITPIPSSVMDFSNFEKAYDDIFSSLLVSSGSGNDKTRYLLGVPIGYETLWVFYNKSLIREVPKSWNDIELLYKQFPEGKYTTNLGLWPTYTPNATDILPAWLIQNDSRSYSELDRASEAVSQYGSFANIGTTSSQTPLDETSTPPSNMTKLSDEKWNLMKDKNTTLDMFMRGDIGLIVWYPSLVTELEKSAKRAGTSNISNIVLTDRLPQFSTRKYQGIARYAYLSVAKTSTPNAIASAKFLEYLMTPDAQRLLMQAYPYYLPWQVAFYNSIESTTLSDTLSKAKLSNFLPKVWDTYLVYQYGMKSRFDQALREILDLWDGSTAHTVFSRLQHDVGCEIRLSNGEKVGTDCEKE